MPQSSDLPTSPKRVRLLLAAFAAAATLILILGKDKAQYGNPLFLSLLAFNFPGGIFRFAGGQIIGWIIYWVIARMILRTDDLQRYWLLWAVLVGLLFLNVAGCASLLNGPGFGHAT